MDNILLIIGAFNPTNEVVAVSRPHRLAVKEKNTLSHIVTSDK
jgi:hypothetical protein